MQFIENAEASGGTDIKIKTNDDDGRIRLSVC